MKTQFSPWWRRREWHGFSGRPWNVTGLHELRGTSDSHSYLVSSDLQGEMSSGIGEIVIRSTASMVRESHRRSAWTEVRRESDNENAVFTVMAQASTSRSCTSSVERRIPTRTSFHPTYRERCHPASGK